MKVELSIKVSYLPDWNISEGIRELVQNAKDAETEGYDKNIFFPRKGILSIQNTGISLSHKVLLFGHTTKENKENQIGKFGEGLKLGILALVRAGRKVKIYTRDEIWTPFITRSEIFDEDILCFNIDKSSDYVELIRIDVSMDEEEWNEQKKNFLFLSPPIQLFNSHYGSVILDPEFKGKIFVKGIFVQDEEDLCYGYDLNSIKVDRDRHMVRSFDLQFTMAEIWKEVGNTNGLQDILYNLLRDDKKDTKSIQYSPYICKELLDHFVNRWEKDHGDAYPVLNAGDATTLKFLGKNGIISSKQLAVVLWERIGNIDDVKKKLSTSITKTYTLSSLSKRERINYLKATSIVGSAIKINIGDFRSRISVVDFNSSKILGQFMCGDIFISKCCLSSYTNAISILVHETAHFLGRDGSKEHMDLIEMIWENILRKLLNE